MTKGQKLFITFIVIGTVICLLVGSTFAYWSWSSNSAQATTVAFTVSSGFSCSADGGGNLTSSDIELAPAKCTDTDYAIKRMVKVNTIQDAGKTIYLDMKLKVDSISTNLSNSQNFKYALTTSSSSCESGIMAEGTFYGTSANSELPLLTKERYLSSTTNDTFYLWVWLDEEETNINTMSQPFKLSLTGSCTDQEPAKTYAPWGAEVDMYKRINFANASSSTNGQGLYVFKPTVNDTYPVYYYRGAVTDNNVLFGGFCWKIVRSTENGGTKLIYNGVSSNGQCTNKTGTVTQLSTTTGFNSSYVSLADVGYMHGARYVMSSKSSSNLSTSYKFGNSFIYNESSYSLVDMIDSTGTWSTDYNTLNNNHYTCFNTTGTCTSLYYVYYTTNSEADYITLTNGKSIENALDEMLTSSTNTTNSTIKTVIDNWYNTNLTSYTSLLEDTIWCNDRSIGELNGWNPNGGSTTAYMFFKPYKRIYSYYSPSLNCQKNDSFTVSIASGNGKLTYPVGIITSDEAMLSGGAFNTFNSGYYLYTGQSYWTISPWSFNAADSNEFTVYSSGTLNHHTVTTTFGVRPSISLKPGGTWSGSGTSSDPYTVSYS